MRKGDEEHDGCVVVLCNGTGEGEKKIEVGKEHAGEKWTDVLGWYQGEVTIDEGKSGVCKRWLSLTKAEGWATFKSPAESIAIWTKTDARGREEFKKD